MTNQEILDVMALNKEVYGIFVNKFDWTERNELYSFLSYCLLFKGA